MPSKHRTQAFDVFESFYVENTTQLNVKLKIIRLDYALEYEYSHFWCLP